MILTDVYAAKEPEASLNIFLESSMKIVYRHAPMRKCIVKARPAPWLNETIKSLMKERDEAKSTLVKSGLVEDRFKYCQLRNQVTKLTRPRSMKKILHAKNKCCIVRW